jgi:hypothetical protein
MKTTLINQSNKKINLNLQKTLNQIKLEKSKFSSNKNFILKKDRKLARKNSKKIKKMIKSK